ncbi:hypothetical protein [Saccharothrix australiensis]|uniref:hypothetical protein n=1 Tax=Saccharothrix australiensis TaxID=2072 RepID=UPI00319DE570
MPAAPVVAGRRDQHGTTCANAVPNSGFAVSAEKSTSRSTPSRSSWPTGCWRNAFATMIQNADA